MRTFTRMFREATATTPHNYLVQLRIGHAMHAMRTTSDSITAIAHASGFNDSNYFSSCFSKLTGVSPSEYRRRFQISGENRPPARRRRAGRAPSSSPAGR
jgi:transcriptional regulator GlxA family with amidase domain